ncbi:MAG: type II toxin-antitoxin system RelE/ParE family toxin [Myxococcales bacterium]|nr:type II toxin-antitoxin system RelE/ParE family toxin [Myxococcales bacterium]
MTYRIEWTRQAQKDLDRLDATLRTRINAAVAELASEPRPPDARPVKSQPGVWRIRVGGYRVLYEIHDGRCVVLILRVRPRGSAYD